LDGGPVPAGGPLYNRQTGTFEYNYEPEITAVIKSFIKKGDTVFDVGANIGWYTTLFLRLVGTSGSVHAFEPVFSTFRKLEQVVGINGANKNTILNQIALMNYKSNNITMAIPDSGHGHGGATAGKIGHVFDNTIKEVKVSSTTLDEYCRCRGISYISCVKCDVEGAELPILQGAENLLNHKDAPLWFLEIQCISSKQFDYLPLDLYTFMKGKNYCFWLISTHGNDSGLPKPGKKLTASDFLWLDLHNVSANVLVSKFSTKSSLGTHITNVLTAI
jgi:FkbM family methyltransferase